MTDFDYSEAQAARILGVSVRSMQRWRREERIEHYPLPGGRIRYNAAQPAAVTASCRRVSSQVAN